MTKRRKKPKDDITFLGWRVNGKLIPDEEFDLVEHVLDPYEKEHGTLRGHPFIEHFIDGIEPWIKKKLKERHAKEKRNLVSA